MDNQIFRGLGELDLALDRRLERYDGMPLVLTPEFAKTFLDASSDAVFAGNTDPDIDIFGPQQLVTVKGEFRSISVGISRRWKIAI